MDYFIILGDNAVAKWENKKSIVINDSLLPLFFKKFSDIDSWLKSRVIDSHRTNSRLLKKALRLKECFNSVNMRVKTNGIITLILK